MSTERQIAMGLKRIGCDVASSFISNPSVTANHAGRVKERLYGSSNNSVDDRLLQVVPVMVDVAMQFSNGENPETMGKEYYEKYLKKVYARVKEWITVQSSSGTSSSSSIGTRDLIVVDDVAALSTQFGSSLTFSFVLQLRSLTKKFTNCCLAILCSHDIDQEQYLRKISDGNQNTSVSGGKKGQWIGAGGGRREIYTLGESSHSSLEQEYLYEFQGAEISWERGLVELADGIIDVTPLPSKMCLRKQSKFLF